MSIAVNFDFSQSELISAQLKRFAKADLPLLADTIGATVVSQTQARIIAEGPGPTGTPWDAWSGAYKATRHGGHSLLIANGHYVQSFDYNVLAGGHQIDIGSNAVQAATLDQGDDQVVRVRAHQRTITQAFGKPISPTVVDVDAFNLKRNIPQRQHLGVSTSDEAELAQVLQEWANQQLELN